MTHPAAAQSLFVRRRDPLGTFLLASAVGHVALVGLAIAVSSVWGSRVIDLDQKPIKASLVRKGKPRDEKLLPRKEALPPPPKKDEIPVPIPGVKPVPVEKATASKAAEKDGEDRRSKLFGAFDKAAKRSKPEELEGQEDGDPEGDSAVQEGEKYDGLLKAQVRRHYDVTNTIPEPERIRLRAQIQIFIGRRGELLEVKFAKGSGNDFFDNAVIGAVKKASPFSPPPEHLRSDLQQHGIVIVFTP